MLFSIIIPVYNRPEEIKELLNSLLLQDYSSEFEVVIVEDGSTLTCEDIIADFNEKLVISYYYKANSGPGKSRNFGMKHAKGDYFIILDSDCIVPSHYLSEVEKSLNIEYVDCYGGSDTALDSFSDVQKAINFSMTSILTTGGIRGGSEKIDTFQPRSFNMGISKEAFEKSSGFGTIHPGEDPDLSFRLWKLGFKTKLIQEAFVYHKRRIDWSKFYLQVQKFGKARPILNVWHPEFTKITYFFPTIFVLGLDSSIIFLIFGFYFPILCYALYFIILFMFAFLKTKSIKIAFLSIIATLIQFYGYGLGYLKSFLLIQVMKKDPKEVFPELFF